MPRRLAILGVSSLALIAAAACGNPDLRTLKVVNVISGYHDAGIQPDKQNKLVPSITFQLKNEGTEPLSHIDLAVDFWQNGDDGPLDDKVVPGIGGQALDPGQTSESLTIHSGIGYTSPAARVDFFTNPVFKGFTVRLFAKFRGRTTPLGELKVEPRLLPSTAPGGNRP
ncbi:MAG TPA: hypothetical protein VFV78_14735 [Vicinamibacterales bacterium]|nr:hypothetical protein [Vicinamibacterales bacterium]